MAAAPLPLQSPGGLLLCVHAEGSDQVFSVSLSRKPLSGRPFRATSLCGLPSDPRTCTSGSSSKDRGVRAGSRTCRRPEDGGPGWRSAFAAHGPSARARRGSEFSTVVIPAGIRVALKAALSVPSGKLASWTSWVSTGETQTCLRSSRPVMLGLERSALGALGAGRAGGAGVRLRAEVRTRTAVGGAGAQPGGAWEAAGLVLRRRNQAQPLGEGFPGRACTYEPVPCRVFTKATGGTPTSLWVLQPGRKRRGGRFLYPARLRSREPSVDRVLASRVCVCAPAYLGVGSGGFCSDLTSLPLKVPLDVGGRLLF